MRCDKDELHFDCSLKHNFDVSGGSIHQTLCVPPADLNLIESLLWDLPPPWYEALNDEAKQSAFASSKDDVTKIYGSSAYGWSRVVRVINILPAPHNSLAYATSDLMYGGESYQASIGKRLVRSCAQLVVPPRMQQPFSGQELNWIGRRLHLFRNPPVRTSLPTSLSTTLASVGPVLMSRPDDNNAVTRFSNNSAFDVNVWRIILQFAIPPSTRNDRLVQASPPYQLADSVFPRAVGLDRDTYVEVEHTEHDQPFVFTVDSTKLNQNQSFQYRHPPITQDLRVSINAEFLAMCFSSRVIVVSHSGEYVSHFDLTLCLHPRQRIELHPAMPYFAVADFLAVEMFDFQGQICWTGNFLSGQTQICHVGFDVANELVLIEQGNKIKVYPFNGKSPYEATLDVEQSPDTSQSSTVFFHWNQNSIMACRWIVR